MELEDQHSMRLVLQLRRANPSFFPPHRFEGVSQTEIVRDGNGHAFKFVVVVAWQIDDGVPPAWGHIDGFTGMLHKVIIQVALV